MARFRFIHWFWDWLLALPGFDFEWDDGNATKSAQKHGVTCAEAEQVFTAHRFIPLGEQYQPPCPEPRFGVLGATSTGKLLLVVFAVRGRRIRVISARPMNKKEREFYAATLP